MKQWAKQRKSIKGFTIVELLIVIVVIAILAAITVVAYTGIQERAQSSAVQSDVANAVKKIEAARIESSGETYPSSLASIGVIASAGNIYDYWYESSDNSYCVQGRNGTIGWYASSNQSTPSVGYCGSDSMVGHWTLNGNTNDISESGLNAIGVSGVTLTMGEDGQVNGAYNFPGSGTAPVAYISMGNSSQFNQRNMTMSVWGRTVTTSGTQVLLAKELNYKFRLAPNSGYTLLTSSNGSGWTNIVNCPGSYAVNTWAHYVFTLSSETGRMRVFMDGTQVCDVAGPSITNFSTRDFMIGSYNAAGTEVFMGGLDDARFYNRALSAAEVKGLYNARAE